MATAEFNPNIQINNKEQSQKSDTSQSTRVHEGDQRATPPSDRSHTTAVMDTDKA